MRIATWNLNNRVGKVRFRPEAAEAAVALGADVLVFTEFFPREHERAFRSTLANAGWNEQQMSAQTDEVANRVLIASKVPMDPLELPLPTFDHQLLANLLAVSLPPIGLAVLGLRVPAYSATPLLVRAWEWIEATATSLKDMPSIVLGDLNVSTTSRGSRGGAQFSRILANGWHRAAPAGGATFFGHKGRNTEIDHVLATSDCVVTEAACVKEAGGYSLCGSPNAISDHAALACRVSLRLLP